MTAPTSIIRRLILWIVLANGLVIVGGAGMYLWRGYDARGSEIADKLEHAAHTLAQETIRTPAGLRMPLAPFPDSVVDVAAVVDAASFLPAIGSHPDLLALTDPVLRRGLTHGTLTLTPPGQDQMTVIVAAADSGEGMRIGIVAHHGDMRSHVWEWVLHELASDILPIFAPLFLSTVAVAAIIIGRGLAPVRMLARQAAALSSEALDLRLPASGLPQELAPLILALNGALDRVETGFLCQRRFTANAAHELRTPLAVLKARCEALGDTPLRDAVMRDIDRMSTIIEQLLAIARIESRQLPMDETLDLAAIAISTVADLYPLAHADNRDISFDQDCAAAPLRGNAALLHGALRNVIENALRLSPPQGVVELRLSAGPVLSVLDRGPGVPAGRRQAIFEPFYRGPGTRGGGAGLGLAIAAEATRLHGGTLTVGERDGGGACFIFDFSPTP